MESQLLQLVDLVKSLHTKVDEQNKELQEIRKENKELHDKIGALTAIPVCGPTIRKKPRAEREQCCALTAKGTQCKNKAVDDGKCKMHINQGEKTIEPKIKKQKKIKPKPPTHNHLPGLRTAYCQLCETHGDIMDPELPNREFEIIATGRTTIDTIREEPETAPEPVLQPVEEQQLEIEDDFDEDESNIMQELQRLSASHNISNWADVEDDDDFFEN
jgi:hypothetical protein